MTALAARIRSIEERLERLDIERLRRTRAARNAEIRIETGTAAATDLDQFLASRIRPETERLVSDALSSAAGGRETLWPADRRMRPAGLAIKMLIADSTQAHREDYHRAIEAIASQHPFLESDLEPDFWGMPPHERWIEANLYLRILGNDHGEELRASIADEVSETIQRAEVLEQERNDAIDGGTARWEDFYFEFRDRHTLDHPLVRAEAWRRAAARADGAPLPVGGTPFDWVCEIGSHVPLYTGHPFEPPALKEALHLLQQACACGVPLGHPQHEHWLDAWRWRNGLGGGMGHTLRVELTAALGGGP